MGGCMGQWVGSGQMTNLIKLELINIIWFCLKIYNLSRHPYLWVDGWVNGWAHIKLLKSNKSWPNQDNSIMDILDILLDILLKPPQPFIGLFLKIWHWLNICKTVHPQISLIGCSIVPPLIPWFWTFSWLCASNVCTPFRHSCAFYAKICNICSLKIMLLCGFHWHSRYSNWISTFVLMHTVCAQGVPVALKCIS